MSPVRIKLRPVRHRIIRNKRGIARALISLPSGWDLRLATVFDVFQINGFLSRSGNLIGVSHFPMRKSLHPVAEGLRPDHPGDMSR